MLSGSAVGELFVGRFQLPFSSKLSSPKGRLRTFYKGTKNIMQTSRSHSKIQRPSDLQLDNRFCVEHVDITFGSSSDDDYSPEMNCKKVIDKPTLVKRLTMGLLRINDQESRPLVSNRSSPSSPSQRNYFYHYINAGIYDVDNKFGDSCRQSLTSIVVDSEGDSNRNTIEYDYKRNVIRETSSANCSPKKFLLSSLKRTDSLNANRHLIDDDIEDLELKEATWFHEGSPREMPLEVLAQQSPGDFIVRRTNNKNGSFTLSLRVPGGSHKIAHYLIVRTHRGYKIKGFHKEFSSLRALITHHSVMPESLPVPLALPRPQNINRKCKNIDDYDTYARLKDLRAIFSDLDVST